MYWFTGNIEGSRVPPKFEFPTQTLKCITIP